jgi:hypothetical protein
LPKARPVPSGKPIGSSRGIGRAIGGELDRTRPHQPHHSGQLRPLAGDRP